jgi:pimeloyl-ACP methyl ester carboxylesterase
MREGEIRALGEIAGRSIARPSTVARDVHGAVTKRVFWTLGPLGKPVRLIHDAVSAASYRGVGAALRTPLQAGGRALSQTAAASSESLADSPLGALALGAANGVFGDRLERQHPDLSLELTVRRQGREVPLDGAGIAAAFADATPKVAVFVHGLCGTEQTWDMRLPGAEPAPTYGARLREDLGFTAVYVRYNTGLHVSDNGRRLAATIERLVSGFPREVTEVALVGHSMGGLVARSACHYGEAEGHSWTNLVGRVVCLGTPHLGAPLERGANVVGWAFNRLPETRPFGDLFVNGRSAGIKDLRFGSCVEEDWCDCDPDEFLRDRCREVPFLDGADYYFVAATLSRRSEGVGGRIGDLLVTYSSASGAGRDRRIPFPIENGAHVGGIDHMRLLNHPIVYAQLRDWLARPRPPATAGATPGPASDRCV